MECHKNIDQYSLRVKVWHIEGNNGALIVHSAEYYFRDSEPCTRSDVPATILQRFDKFADECFQDYVEEIEE